MFPYNKRAAYALFSKLGLALIAGAALTISSSLFATEAGSLFVTDLATGSVIVYDQTGAATTFDTGLISPQGIAFDNSKNLYVVDAGDGTAGAGTIFKYDLSVGGSRVPFRTGLNNPQGLAFDGSALLVSENGEGRVLRVPVAGTPTILQLIPTPLGLAVHGINNQTGLYKYICNGPLVREIAPPPSGTITDFDFSADGSRAAAVDMAGVLFVSTDSGSIIEIEPGGVTQTLFASGFTQPTGMDFRPARFGGDTDKVGFLYVADTAAGTISQISLTGDVTQFVAAAGMPNYMVFQTVSATPLPLVVTGVASSIGDMTATLNGTVNPSGSETTYQFQYGLTTGYGSTTTITSAGSGFTAVPVSAPLTGLSPGTLYHFRVTATNSGGTVNGADGTFTTFLVPPTPTPTPTPIVVTGVASNIGETTATLNGTVNPIGSDTTYQFEYGLTASYGSTTSITSAGNGFTAVPVSAELSGLSAGTYHFRVTATNDGGTANGGDATFTTAGATPTADKAQNLSTRVDVETGDNVGIGGFIITGTDPKLVVIRAIGPSLANFGVTDPLADPVLELHDSTGAIIATNDDWMNNNDADRQMLIDHGLDPTNDLESAIITTLDPGLFTAVVSGSNGGTGVALIEIYDLDDPAVAGELGNLSTRGLVGTDANVLIGGVIIGPEGGLDAAVVLRAIGPSLADFGVTGALADPVLELRNGDGDVIATNDNWMDNTPADQATLTDDMLAPTNDLESAIVANLISGLYTAIVSGKDGTTGVGLVEVYHVATP
jgi:hypothetical protein